MDRRLLAVLFGSMFVVAAVAGAGAAVLVESPSLAPVQGESSPTTGDERPDNGGETLASVDLNVSGSAYTALYNRTIDSVVTVRVETPRGVGQGSGFVYDSRGHIVTNQHVVESATNVLVRFSDGTWREARVVGTDVYTDLAVLEVENVPAYVDPLPVADENPVEGQRVAALGSPLGLEGSITSGIVSGVNRSMETDRNFAIPATIQTDAPINPGNSGGPLVSMNGTVVGVNRAKQGDNIGFAISPLLVQRVVPELIADGTYRHPYMGISTIPVTPTIADVRELDRTRGVLVFEVVDGGPSEGVLRPATERTRVDGQLVPANGDIILSVDGRPVTSQQQLARILMLHTRPGETVPVTILRDGTRQTVSVTLGARPEL